MFRYSSLEEKKSCFPAVINLHNSIFELTDQSYLKVCRIENNENVIKCEEFKEQTLSAINEVVSYLNSYFRGNLINVSHVEYHNYEGENVENFIGKSSSDQVDGNIFSFYFYINNDYEEGDMLIYERGTDTWDENEDENISKVLDSDEFLKILCINSEIACKETASTGHKKCIVFHIRFD